MAELSEFLPQLKIEFDGEGKSLKATVNGQIVKFVNGTEEKPVLTQTSLGLVQRIQDLAKIFPKIYKEVVVPSIAALIRSGVVAGEGVRKAVINERSRMTPAYKDAFEDVTREWGEAKFMSLTEGWGEDTFNKITKCWKKGKPGKPGEPDKPGEKEKFLKTLPEGLSWTEKARKALIHEQGDTNNWNALARAAHLVKFSSPSTWDELEIVVAE